METCTDIRLRALDGSPPSEGPGPRIETTDVVVVGARCAGAPTAMLLARYGHDVVVVDRAEFPSDTLSTHAIARGGVVQLQRWGILERLLESGVPQLRRADFHVDGEIITRAVKDRYGVDFVVAPRRHVLDPLLQEAATAPAPGSAPGSPSATSASTTPVGPSGSPAATHTEHSRCGPGSSSAPTA